MREPYIGEHVTFESAWIPKLRKDGKPGRRLELHLHYYTPLFTCDICGFTSTPKKVQYRNECYDPERGETPLLCTSCWNRYRRRILLPLQELDAARQLVKTLRRECAASHHRNVA